MTQAATLPTIRERATSAPWTWAQGMVGQTPRELRGSRSVVLHLGSELWLLYFDPEKNAYTPKCVGTISRVIADRYFAGGKWHQPGHPHWGSEAEAKAWVDAHPFTAPTIK